MEITDKNKLCILALDPATHCGWAISNEIYGVWDLSVKADESLGMRLIRLRAKLRELYGSEKFNVVFFERPAGMHKKPIIVQAELQGVIKTFCEDNKIEYRAVSSQEIKKYATGKGNCNKMAMIQAAKEKLNYSGKNDNEADALWILSYAKFVLKTT